MALTGGTGDVNPQWLKIRVTQTAADAITTQTQNIPIQRLRSKGKAQLMEVLKVFWSASNDTAEVDSFVHGSLTTKSFGTTACGINEPTVISYFQERRLLTTSGLIMPLYPIMHDLTDGAGHGLLVATDNIYLQADSASTSIANVIDCHVLYRWKDVGITEYIGIVQSQQ